MALTKCTVPDNVIGSLGTTAQERGLTTQEFKNKFDEIPEGIKEYINNVLTTELDNYIADYMSHKAERVTKVILTTHDLSLAGQQSIAEVGFRPQTVIIFATVSGVAGKASLGFSDSTINLVISDFANAGIAGSYRMLAPYAVCMQDSIENSTLASVQSFDANGLTLNWEKTGTGATGNADIAILALSHY